MFLPTITSLILLASGQDQELKITSQINCITPPIPSDIKGKINGGLYYSWREKLYHEQISMRKEAQTLEKQQSKDVSVIKQDMSALASTLKIPEVAQLQALMNDEVLTLISSEYAKTCSLAISEFKHITPGTSNYSKPEYDKMYDKLEVSRYAWGNPTIESIANFESKCRSLWNKFSQQLVHHEIKVIAATEAARRTAPGIVTEVAIRKIKIQQLRILWNAADSHTKMLFIQ